MNRSRIAVFATLLLALSCTAGKESGRSVSRLTIDPAEISVSLGLTKSLSVRVEPEDAEYLFVSWTSSDPKVAYVSKLGKIKGVAIGTATITASVGDVSATCLVHVAERSAPVSGIRMDQKDASVGINGNVQLTATLEPEDAANLDVSWSSSDPSIATVAPDGTVTGVSAGSCRIVVTSADGGFTDDCTVTVEKIALERISFFNGAPGAIVVRQGATQTLLLAFEPADASFRKATWQTSDPSLATVSDEEGQGKVTFGSGRIGVVDITATADDKSVTQTFFVGTAEPLCTLPEGKVYAGRPVTYTFNSAAYADAANVSWRIDGEAFYSPSVTRTYTSGGEKEVFLTADFYGRTVTVAYPVKVEDFLMDIGLPDGKGQARNTHPVFNKAGTRAYFLTRQPRNLYEVNLETGELGWCFEMHDAKQDNGGEICVNPFTGDIIASNQGNLFCLREDGTVRWQITSPGFTPGGSTPTSSLYGSGPAISNDGSVIFAPVISTLLAVRASDGTIIDRISESLGHVQMAVYGDNDLVVHYNRENGAGGIHFYHFDGEKFSETAVIDSPSRDATDISSPTINREQTRAWFPCREGKLVEVDLTTKTVSATRTITEVSGDSYLMSPCISEQGHIYLASQTGAAIYRSDASDTGQWQNLYDTHVSSMFNFMGLACDRNDNVYFYVKKSTDSASSAFCRILADGSLQILAKTPYMDYYQAVFAFCDGFLLAAGYAPDTRISHLYVRCIDAARAKGWSGFGGDCCATKNANLVYKD